MENLVVPNINVKETIRSLSSSIIKWIFWVLSHSSLQIQSRKPWSLCHGILGWGWGEEVGVRGLYCSGSTKLLWKYDRFIVCHYSIRPSHAEGLGSQIISAIWQAGVFTFCLFTFFTYFCPFHSSSPFLSLGQIFIFFGLTRNECLLYTAVLLYES